MLRLSKYYSTHSFLIEHFEDLPEAYKLLLLSKRHPIRQIQDKFCYIHSKVYDQKVFSPRLHKKLETSIRNNLKFFSIEYLQPLPDSEIDILMIREATLQITMLQRMNCNQVLFNRIDRISFFLSYSYSRSYDHFVRFERLTDDYTFYVLKLIPDKSGRLCLQK